MRLSTPSRDMRHLSVPRADTATVFKAMREAGWLPPGARVRPHPYNEELRLIPIIAGAPAGDWPIIEAEEPPIPTQTYRDLLSDFLAPSIVEAKAELWPTRHEILGDLILIKVPGELMEYGAGIGQALLTQHPRIRLVLHDDGVEGIYRVRRLIPLAERTGNTFQIKFDETPRTRTCMRESGHQIWTDPAQVYFSGRLSREREETLVSCQFLREKLGRSLNICDPYAGVGPALLPLLASTDLVESAFGGDLNPAAVELMRENLSRFDNVRLECGDAQALAKDPTLRHAFDALLVNIPHSTVEHLPLLLPLLKKTSSTLLRGWLLLEEAEMDAVTSELRSMLPSTCEFEISIRRSYSTHQQLCRFEARMKP